MTQNYDYNPSDDRCVIITPHETHYNYTLTDRNDDVFGAVFDDPNLGQFFVALTPRQAYTIAENLLTMCKQIEALRAQRINERKSGE